MFDNANIWVTEGLTFNYLFLETEKKCLTSLRQFWLYYRHCKCYVVEILDFVMTASKNGDIFDLAGNLFIISIQAENSHTWVSGS